MRYYAIAGLWLFSLGLVFQLGYFTRTIINRIATIEKGLRELARQKLTKEKEKPKSSFIDPTDPVMIARLEHDEKLRLLNPEQ